MKGKGERLESALVTTRIVGNDLDGKPYKKIRGYMQSGIQTNSRTSNSYEFLAIDISSRFGVDTLACLDRSLLDLHMWLANKLIDEHIIDDDQETLLHTLVECSEDNIVNRLVVNMSNTTLDSHSIRFLQ